MKIIFIGTGYVGLVSGVMMSHLGHEVTCIDTDLAKIQKLQKGQSPIFEPGLDEYIQKYSATNLLRFASSSEGLDSNAQAVFITVGTPPLADGSADLSYIYEAVEMVSQYIQKDCLIIIKSTVPPGTCGAIKEYMLAQNIEINIASNPEFLREGNAIEDFLKPDRIVIGAESDDDFTIMREIYKPLSSQGVKILEANLNTSELIKYASNTFLANKIAFINEMANLCEIIGADIETLSEGVGSDRRIGKDFLKAGPGFGGSCFPKDILALQHLSKKVNSDLLILDAIIKANTNRPIQILEKIKNIVGGNLQGKKLAIWGLTYKAGTDDLRSSPAIDLINLLKQQQVQVVAYDPKGMKNAPKYFDDLDCADSAFSAATDSDGVIIVTEWPEFKKIDYTKLKSIVKTPTIIDLRNLLEKDQMVANGYKYYSIGRC